jgi:hypothetical protein
MKKFTLWAASAAFAACMGLGHAVQPYSAWTKYREVLINTTNANGGANVAGAVTSIPILVRLTNASEAAGANVLSEALAGGADIRFTDSTGTVALGHDVDTWTASSAAVWVHVPTVAGNAVTKVRLYWNRSGAPTVPGTAFGSASNFLGVWHMGNSANPVDPRPNAVAGGNPATPVNLTNVDNTFKPGAIGMSDTLRSLNTDQTTSDYFDLGDGYADFGSGQVTLSMWVWRTSVNNSWNQFLSFGNDANLDNIWMGKRGSAAMNFTFEVPPPTSHIDAAGALLNNQNQWIHLVATNNAGTSQLYVDGVEVMTGTTGAPTAVNRVQNYIARSVDAWADRNLRGKVDEVRVSNAHRTANWVKLDYETQKLTATAVTLGATQTPAAPPLAYLVKNASFLINQAITPIGNVTNGTVSGNFTIAPALPTGLAFNATTGVISGTPTQAAAAASYVVTVTVNGSAARDTLNLAVTSGTPPGVPLTVSATGGNAQATVSWSAPASSGSSAITGYLARATQDTAKSCAWTTGALSCVITGLTNGTSYTFVVRASSAAGTSAFSAASAAVTPATVPGSPTAVTATVASATSVLVTWTAPTSTGGLPVTDYYVTGAPGGQLCYSPAVASPSCTVTGLTAGVSYTFTAVAANAAGNSPASAPSNAVTPGGTGIFSGYAIRVTGSSKPFSFALTKKAAEATDALTMTISDVYGRTVWSRTVNPKKEGVTQIVWNGRATTGRAVSAGMYIVRVAAVNGGATSEFIQKAADVK